jgi:DNA polymerase
MPNADLRGELASVAASLRAYVEQQIDSGATGIPRRGAAQAPGSRLRAPVEQVRPAGAIANRAAPGLETEAGSSTPAHAPAIARTLPQVADAVAGCTRCGLASTRTNTVFSRGNPDARLCFVGEAPGADEDAQGLPFVGRAGQLLDRMIAAMGLSPERDVYVCNIIKCRPPENRRPEPDEIATCIPYLHEQLALVAPKVIVAMGNTAVGALLNTKMGITKIRGQWKLYKGAVPVMPTYHPSYLIRPSAQQAEAKRQAWEDLQAVMKELGLVVPKKG